MKRIVPIILIVLLVSIACSLTAPLSPPTTDQPQAGIPTLTQAQVQADLPLTEDDVPRVTLEEAKAALENGEAVIVDVRSAEFYSQEHIAGAISIPLAEIDPSPVNIPLDKNIWIITYCT